MGVHNFAVIPASYVFLRSDRGVLLQLRQNTGFMDGKWAAGAAGHVELGETALQTAVRELREELGVEVDPRDLHCVAVMQRTDGTDTPREQRVEWFFTCDRWQGEPTILEPHKCGALEWFSLDALPDEMPDHELHALDAVRRETTAEMLFHGPSW